MPRTFGGGGILRNILCTYSCCTWCTINSRLEGASVGATTCAKWENAYLEVKNAQLGGALQQAPDPHVIKCGIFTSGNYSNVRGIHVWRGHFMFGRYSRKWKLHSSKWPESFICQIDICVIYPFKCGQASNVKKHSPCVRRHAYVGAIHVWRGIPHVEGT